MVFDPNDLVRSSATSVPNTAPAPLAGNRTERMQRLQIGLFGLAMMVLLVGLANIIMDSAEQTRQTVSAEAVPETPPSADPSQASDPLADAGVVPDLPADSADGKGGAQIQPAIAPGGDMPAPAAPAGPAPSKLE